MTTEAPERVDGEAVRRPGELTRSELLRWALRRLTSMRTALILLFLLAVAAAPGSFVPQRSVDPQQVASWQVAHPRATPWLERLDLFNVYGSAWFSAIYLLLMASLVGCVVPRLLTFLRALAAPPPRLPENLSAHGETRLVDVWPSTAQAFLGRTGRALRRRGFRVRVDRDGLVAERGRLREVGNLLFHASVLVVLVGFAYGKLYGFTGAVVVVQGESFVNSVSQYDNFLPGGKFAVDDLDPMSVSLDRFQATYLPSGQPSSFTADVRFRDETDGSSGQQRLEVNSPLTLGDTSLFLIGHGYAPIVTVRDGNGDVTYSGPTVFLPLDGSLHSYGVIKAPDARPSALALDGDFYPTAGVTASGETYSAFPGLGRPQLVLQAYEGDLGLDDGQAQNVYSLRKTGLRPLGEVRLEPGDQVALPDGAGTISFDGVEPWARLQVSSSPGDTVVLAGVVLGLGGMLLSLFVRRRRVWIRVSPHDELVETAASSGRKELVDDPDLSQWVSELHSRSEHSPERSARRRGRK